MSDDGADDQGSLEWATERLRRFVDASSRVLVPPPSGVIGPGSYKTKSPDDLVVEQWAVVERILQHYLPDWQARVQEPDGYDRRGYRWRAQREAALLCLAAIEAEAEIERHLADNGPSMTAAELHPWVWEAAKPAWSAKNFDDAVDAAARNLNSQLRAKVGRRDIGEGDLVAQVFSDKRGDEDQPRLRLAFPQELGTRTTASIYAGISAFGKGLFQAVRNPLAHEAPGATGLGEQDALECLAALSLLARWIDRATVHRS
ncbi:MAG: TIGR02391 family protein [Acidimicrobiia bacterium]|nr:TIGR02391 family protein [Acidimicrobiia bacterium]